MGVARLGNDVALIGKVGSDYDSAVVYSCMEENHVDVRESAGTRAARPEKTYIHVQNDGESTITILTGANQSCSPRISAPSAACSRTRATVCSRRKSRWRQFGRRLRSPGKTGVKNILKTGRHQPDHAGSHAVYRYLCAQPQGGLSFLCPQIADVEGRGGAFSADGGGNCDHYIGTPGLLCEGAGLYQGICLRRISRRWIQRGGGCVYRGAGSVSLRGVQDGEGGADCKLCGGILRVTAGVIPALIDRNSLEGVVRRMEDWGV